MVDFKSRKVDTKEEVMKFIENVVDEFYKENLMIKKSGVNGWPRSEMDDEVWEDLTSRVSRMIPIPNVDEQEVFRTGITYIGEFNCGDNKNSTIEIKFNFESFNNQSILSVEILLANFIFNAIPEEPSTLEKIKIKLSRALNKRFSKCFWLYDRESQSLSEVLYPLIHENENLSRQFVELVMISQFGFEWWNKLPENTRNAFLKMSGNGKQNAVDEELTDKERIDKATEFRQLSPKFRHIHEKLQLLNIGDLLKIMTLQRKAVDTNTIKQINQVIENYEATNEELEILNRFKAKLPTIEFNLKEVFFQYIDENFIEKFNDFNTNRNHVAHNKLLDFQAYLTIKNSVLNFQNTIQNALEKFHKNNPSLERKFMENIIKGYEDDFFNRLVQKQRDIDTDHIRYSESEILEEFQKKYLSFFESVENIQLNHHHLDLSDFDDLENSESEYEVFALKNSTSKSTLKFYCSTFINDGYEDYSYMYMILEHDGVRIKNYEIQFTNAGYEERENESYVMPSIEAIFDDDMYDKAIKFFDDYILNFI